MSRFRAALPIASGVALALALGWLAGFLWFLEQTRYPVVVPPHADGVVALTGGAGRVELALRLLERGTADRLLISGIGGGTDLTTLGRLAGVDTTALADRITLGRYAASTTGNGVETAAWAEQNRLRSLLVVTATYHMPRALAALRRVLPQVQLLPVPVHPHAEGESAGEHGPGWRLEASEYVKYLVTISGLSQWWPRREATAAPPAPPGAGV